MKGIYKEKLIDHYKNPRNFGVLDQYTNKGESINESCGDEIYVYLNIENEVVKEISFQGFGCAICIGTMSQLTVKIQSKGLDEISKLTEKDILDLISMDEASPRKKCATIGLSSLNNALSNTK